MLKVGDTAPDFTLITGRGCNNACTFCRDPQIMYGYKLRNRTAQKVVDEMEYGLKVHPQIREIMFETDTFAADDHHVREVCEEIVKRGLDDRKAERARRAVEVCETGTVAQWPTRLSTSSSAGRIASAM